MPTWTPLDDDPDTGDSVPVAFLRLQDQTGELRKAFASATPPDAPVEGQFWLDTSASPYQLSVYAQIDAGAADWRAVAILPRLSESPNADPSVTDDRAAPYEFKALRVENRATLPTAESTNAGLLVYRTSDGEFYIADQPVSGGWKGLLSVRQGASYDTVELPLEGDVGNDATNPPTQTRKGALEGWLFDATNEKRTFAFVVPPNWFTSVLKLRLWQVLTADESAGDDIEWSGEFRALAPAAGKTGQTATALVDVATDIGAEVDGIADGGGPHVTTLSIPAADVDNPISVGCLVLVTVWRKTVGGAGLAGGTLVFRAELAYVQTPRHERA